MVERSFNGDESITNAMNMGMKSTISSLVHSGYLSKTQADEFLDTHVCMMVTNDNIWSRIIKYVGIMFSKDTDNEYQFSCLVVKVAHEKDRQE